MPGFAKKVRLRGVFYWEKVRALSLTNVTIANMYAGASFGGVTLAAGDIICAAGQTTPAENGVYTVQAASNAPVRLKNWNVGDSVVGYCVRVYAGTNAGNVYAVYAQPAVIGTNDPQFIKHERI